MSSNIFQVLSSPTPFIIGVHSAHQDHIADLLDVIVVDLDGGIIHVPENMTLHRVMEPLQVGLKYFLLARKYLTERKNISERGGV